MSIDEELRHTVIEALRANQMLDASDISVAVNQQVATLTGTVGGYFQKQEASETTRRVAGIRGVAEALDVILPGPHIRDDIEIALAASNALLWNVLVPVEVKVNVENGWLTLTGKVDWAHQKRAAQNAVRLLTGVRGVSNEIEVAHSTPSATVKKHIEDTLRLASEREAKQINVEANDGVVTLSGTVRSLSEKNDANRAAWNVPGVFEVEDHLQVVAWT